MAEDVLAHNLRNALATLYAALREPGVIDGREDIVVTLPSADAGLQFELWLVANPPDQLRYSINNWGREIDPDGPNPHREITLDGIAIRWPTGRVMTPDGAKPRPVAEPIDVPAFLPSGPRTS